MNHSMTATQDNFLVKLTFQFYDEPKNEFSRFSVSERKAEARHVLMEVSGKPSSRINRISLLCGFMLCNWRRHFLRAPGEPLVPGR
jgi:hypothetical protein